MELKQKLLHSVEDFVWTDQTEQRYLKLIQDVQEIHYSENKLTNWRDVGLMPILQ